MLAQRGQVEKGCNWIGHVEASGLLVQQDGVTGDWRLAHHPLSAARADDLSQALHQVPCGGGLSGPNAPPGKRSSIAPSASASWAF